MGFSLGAFGRGFATAAVTDKKETEDRINSLVDQAYLEKLKDAKEIRKDRKAKRESLVSLANQYKAMGITDESQIAGLIAVGPEAAARNLELLQATAQTYRQQDKIFDINSFVKGTGIEGLTIEDGINRIMGEAQPADQDFVMDIPGAKKDRGILGGLFADPQKIAQKRMEERESVYGESMGQLAAETGDLTYGDVGQVSLDLGAMFLPDEDRDLDRKIKLENYNALTRQAGIDDLTKRKLQLELTNLEQGIIEPDKLPTLSDRVDKKLGDALSNAAGDLIGWDARLETHISAGASRENMMAFDQKKRAVTSDVLKLMQGQYVDPESGETVPKMNYDDATKYAVDNIIPNMDFSFSDKETEEERQARLAREKEAAANAASPEVTVVDPSSFQSAEEYLAEFMKKNQTGQAYGSALANQRKEMIKQLQKQFNLSRSEALDLIDNQ